MNAKEKAIKTIKSSRQTHIEWRDFFEKNPVLQGSTEYKHLGDIEYHKKCIKDYYQVLALLNQFEELETDFDSCMECVFHGKCSGPQWRRKKCKSFFKEEKIPSPQ